MPFPTPSTTTYALLALLALRPWTGYELTRQVRRSLHYGWPRSEANLYNEQKQLVRLGWATVTKEKRGKRTRNRYEITAKGRRELRAWMRTEPDVPRFEIEGLLRIFFADQGSVEDLLLAVRVTRDGAARAVGELCEFVDEYVATGGPFPNRLHLIAMAADLLTDLLSRIEIFCDEAAQEVGAWETTRDQGMTDAARERFDAIARRQHASARAATGRDAETAHRGAT